MKKSNSTAAIALMMQALLAASALATASGLYLLWQARAEAKEKRENRRLAKRLSEEQNCDIPVDRDASESEFE